MVRPGTCQKENGNTVFIIITGTPLGVGIGFDPPLFLKSGDVVRVTIDPIGTIENTVE